MFDVLPASDAHLDVRRRWVTMSFAVHALAVAVVVMLTRGALEAARSPVSKEAIQLYVPEPPMPAPRAPLAPNIVAEPPEVGFRTVPPVIEIPSTIPPIDLSERRFDPRDVTGIGSENGVANGPVSTPAGGIYDANAVLEGFDPAVLLSQPTPRYPATLQSAGVAGSVVLEFVIDTTGRVERGSVRMIESSHPAFEDAARAAVLGARFRPAHLGGRPVRQVTRQRVRFVATD